MEDSHFQKSFCESFSHYHLYVRRTGKQGVRYKRQKERFRCETPEPDTNLEYEGESFLIGMICKLRTNKAMNSNRADYSKSSNRVGNDKETALESTTPFDLMF